MIKIRVLLLLALLTGANCCFAQHDYEQVKSEINKVKKSNAYLYGEANAETEEDAHGIAEEILYNEINEWAAKKKRLQGGELVINNKKELQTSLSAAWQHGTCICLCEEERYHRQLACGGDSENSCNISDILSTEYRHSYLSTGSANDIVYGI